MKVRIIPGINNSDDDHWQSKWECKYGFTRVEQNEWKHPLYKDWEVKLMQELKRENDKDNIIVAHSLGCLLTAKAFPKIRQYIKAILLVAPPDPHGENFPKFLDSFNEIPKDNLGIPGILIFSENDEYSSPEFSRALGDNLGLEVISVGRQGHINSKSNLGDWNEGYQLLQKLIVELSVKKRQ